MELRMELRINFKNVQELVEYVKENFDNDEILITIDRFRELNIYVKDDEIYRNTNLYITIEELKNANIEEYLSEELKDFKNVVLAFQIIGGMGRWC